MSNNPNADPNVEQLLREGIAAVRAGDRETARVKLREVVERDQFSEQGWYWLAAVAQTIEEKRTCLGNVVVINPNNEKAKAMLERLSLPNATLIDPARATETPKKAGSPPVAIIAGVAVVMALVVVVILFGNRGGTAADATATPIPETNTPDPAPSQTAAAVALQAEQTQTAIATRRMLPPTWTPSPAPTSAQSPTPTPLPALPEGVAGRLIIQTGKPLSLDRLLPLFVYDIQTGERTPITDGARADYGRFAPNGRRVIFARLVTGARAQLLLRIANLNGTEPVELSEYWRNQPPLANQQMVSVAKNGAGVVFVANNVIAENDPTSDVYYLPLRFSLPGEPTITPTLTITPSLTPEPGVTPPPTDTPAPTNTPLPPLQVQRVTAKDSGVNTWPDISPDGQNVVFVSDRTDIGGPSADVYLVPITGGEARNLTNDAEGIESAPAWSPDGTQIAYVRVARGEKTGDLYLMNALGSERKALVTGFGNITRPLWSPDGKYIAFTSDRTGRQEVYAVDLATGEIYQITALPDQTIATDWGQ